MFYHTESKPQTWRALATFADGAEGLICLGRSSTQVRAGYQSAFAELLDDEERARVTKIALQCWAGAADRGRWTSKAVLSIPGRAGTRLPAHREESSAPVLPFRLPAQAEAVAPAPASAEDAGEPVGREEILSA